MYLGITTYTNGSSALTANYPYPNLKCNVTLKCDSDGSLSSNIIATSYDYANTWPWCTSNNIFVSTLSTSQLDTWYN